MCERAFFLPAHICDCVRALQCVSICVDNVALKHKHMKTNNTKNTAVNSLAMTKVI